MKTAITVQGLEPKTEVSITPEAQELKSSALALAKPITVVFDAKTQELAVDAERQIKRILADVESFREQIKKPVLDLGRDIDAKAKQFRSELETERDRLNRLNVAYENKKAMDAAKERERLQREADEAKRIEEAKLAALQAETNPAKIEVLKEEVEQAALVREMQQVEAEISTPSSSVAGMGVKKEYDYEVVEINAFAQQYPDLVKIEVKRRETLEAIKSGRFNVHEWSKDQQMSVPTDIIGIPAGLRVFEVTKINVR